MKIEFTLPSRRGVPPLAFTPTPECDPSERPHRIARVMALAHKLDELVRSGEVPDHGELARLGHVSPARICQYMTLLHLAPAIKEKPPAEVRTMKRRKKGPPPRKQNSPT
jgi:hypothetical protein